MHFGAFEHMVATMKLMVGGAHVHPFSFFNDHKFVINRSALNNTFMYNSL